MLSKNRALRKITGNSESESGPRDSYIPTAQSHDFQL